MNKLTKKPSAQLNISYALFFF